MIREMEMDILAHLAIKRVIVETVVRGHCVVLSALLVDDGLNNIIIYGMVAVMLT